MDWTTLQYLADTFLTKDSAFKDTSCRLFPLQISFLLSRYCSRIHVQLSNALSKKQMFLKVI